MRVRFSNKKRMHICSINSISLLIQKEVHLIANTKRLLSSFVIFIWKILAVLPLSIVTLSKADKAKWICINIKFQSKIWLKFRLCVKNNKLWLQWLANENKRQTLTYSLIEILLVMSLVKFKLVFATIINIRKHMVMRLDREISSASFCCGLTVRVAWPLVWIDRLVVAWPFTEKNSAYGTTGEIKI